MRRGELIVNALPVVGILVAWSGTMSLAHTERSLWLCLTLYVAGVACLVVAKLPELRRGRWFAFGPSAQGRRWYGAAYIILGAAALLNVGMLLALQT